MTPEDPPPAPPWTKGGTASVEERNRYDEALLLAIKVRDLKHDALTHHVMEHCQ